MHRCLASAMRPDRPILRHLEELVPAMARQRPEQEGKPLDRMMRPRQEQRPRHLLHEPMQGRRQLLDWCQMHLQRDQQQQGASDWMFQRTMYFIREGNMHRRSRCMHGTFHGSLRTDGPILRHLQELVPTTPHGSPEQTRNSVDWTMCARQDQRPRHLLHEPMQSR
jgi:hypothetical protein